MGEWNGPSWGALFDRCSGPSDTMLAPGVDGTRFDWNGLSIMAEVRDVAPARRVLVLASELGPYDTVVARIPLVKLLEHMAAQATVRLAVRRDRVLLESALPCDELDPARRDDALRWRVTELYAVAMAWRARLGTSAHHPESVRARNLAELKSDVRLPSEEALLVAAVAFGVAGADGVFTHAERGKLHAWLAEVPAFCGLDPSRVVRAIAALVQDPARTLMASARHLEPRARLFAWALANDMAYADGFASDEERRYLANVATVFKLPAEAMAPLAAEAQRRAVARETIEPPPPVV